MFFTKVRNLSLIIKCYYYYGKIVNHLNHYYVITITVKKKVLENTFVVRSFK